MKRPKDHINDMLNELEDNPRLMEIIEEFTGPVSMARRIYQLEEEIDKLAAAKAGEWL